MTAEGASRVNQKFRTRTAIVEAARELLRSGAPVTMPEVARAALVSEVTAYRYFPDLPSLLSEVIAGLWPSPAEALQPVATSSDPVERVAFACEVLLRGVAAYQGGVRAMIAATAGKPAMARARPGLRFELIDLALDPLRPAPGAPDPDALVQLKRELAVVISAESLFCLTDRLGLETGEAIACVVRMAATLTAAAAGGRSPTVRRP
jgi:AcrR family transcriptional regulator